MSKVCFLLGNSPASDLYMKSRIFMSKFVGTGPLSYKKRIYRAVVSQRLRNTGLLYYTLSHLRGQQRSQSVLWEHHISGMRYTQGIYNSHGHIKNTKTWIAGKQYSAKTIYSKLRTDHVTDLNVVTNSRQIFETLNLRICFECGIRY